MLKVTAEGTTFTLGLRRRREGVKHARQKPKEKRTGLIDDGSTRGKEEEEKNIIKNNDVLLYLLSPVKAMPKETLDIVNVITKLTAFHITAATATATQMKRASK